MTSPTILVLGASGFIGGWVTEALTLRGFDTIRAGVRNVDRVSRVSDLPVKATFCDILNRDSLMAAMENVEVVINCVRDDASPGANVEGARKLLDCATASGTKKLIQMSSVAVYGNATGEVTEDTPPVAPISAYGAEKRVVEEMCQAAAGQRLHLAVLRPSLVYGPFGEEWTARFVRGIVSGRIKRLGEAGNGQANLIYAGDLGRFAAHLALEDIPPYAVYNANGADIPTFDEYFDLLSHALGRGPIPRAHESRVQAGIRRQTRRVGRHALKSQAAVLRKAFSSNAVLEGLLEKAEKTLRYDFGDEPADTYAKRRTFTIQRAKQIGFVPQTSLKDGIAASAAWAQSSGLAC